MTKAHQDLEKTEEEIEDALAALNLSRVLVEKAGHLLLESDTTRK